LQESFSQVTKKYNGGHVYSEAVLMNSMAEPECMMQKQMNSYSFSLEVAMRRSCPFANEYLIHSNLLLIFVKINFLSFCWFLLQDIFQANRVQVILAPMNAVLNNI